MSRATRARLHDLVKASSPGEQGEPIRAVVVSPRGLTERRDAAFGRFRAG